MHQVLHIFRKDLRHFWPEALVCLLITAAFARIYPVQWADAESIRMALGGYTLPPTSLQTLAGVVTALVPISWFVLITRLIHDETLVGERPYWFTRPYEWPLLLAAKLLFIGLFVVLPLAIAQATLLHLAGFAVLPCVGGLLYLLGINLGAFILPMVCLAVITRNFLRASLTLLAGVAIIIAIALLVSDHSEPSPYLPYVDRFSFPLCVLIGCAVVVSQYASRRTWLARSLIVVSIPLVVVFASNPLEAHMLEDVYYIQPASSIPVTLALPPQLPTTTADHLPAVSAADDDKTETLSLPLAISGVPYGYWVEADNAKLLITGSDGTQFSSPWHAKYNHLFRQGTEEAALSFQVPKPFLERIRKSPVSLVMTLALTQWEAGNSTHYAMPARGDLTMPGFGICSNAETPTQPNAALRCRFALHAARKTLVSAQVTEEPCPAPPATPLQTFTESYIIGELSPDPADVGLTSVWDSSLNLGYQQNTDSSASANAHICPGAEVSLTPYHVVRRAQYVIHADHIAIPTLKDPVPLAFSKGSTP